MSQQPTVLRTDPGSALQIEGRTYHIIKVVDLQKFLCRDAETGERLHVDLRTQKATSPWEPSADSMVGAADLQAFTEDQWETARKRKEIIEPLLGRTRRGDATAKNLAEGLGYSAATVYRWLKLYRDSGGRLSSLIDSERGGGQRKSRLGDDVDAIITAYIRDEFLTEQKPSFAEAYDQITLRCKNAGYPEPALNTIKLRVQWISDAVKVEKRLGKDEARNRHEAERGKVRHADFPLQLAMMDHTPLPVIIVDEVHRKPMGRAILTAMIDVYSRVALGIYLSLDDPCTASAGMCIGNALLTKDNWLAELGVNHEWPFWGSPDVLQMDNAGEFRGETIRFVCNEYDIDVQFRPVKRPNYGGHIERLMGTVSQKLKAVKGATFSGPEERGVYDSEGNACLTFDELHRWLAVLFTKYHNDKHSAIGMTPRQKWTEGLLRRAPDGILRGLPPIRTDADKVRLDFLPIEYRTIQADGVKIDKVTYQDTILHPFIGRKQPDSNRGIEHPFRRDPRDISEILFFHPDLKQYFTIAGTCEKMSLWQWREAGRAIKEVDGVDSVMSRHDYVHEMNEIIENVGKTTKAVLKRQAKLKNNAKNLKKKPLTVNRQATKSKAVPTYDPSEVQALPDDED